MDLLQISQQGSLVVFLLVAVRTSAAMAVGPFAAWPGVPLPGRVLLGLGIALALAPAVPTAVPSDRLVLGPVEIVQELMLGLMLGVAASLLVSALQFAAGMVDFHAGFTFGASIDPIAGHQTGPIEHFLGALASVLFLDLNGHHLFLLALADWFRVAPVAGTPHLAGPDDVVGFFTVIAVAALTMALPIVTPLLLVDTAFAVLGRVAPQFNILAVGLPARNAVVLVVLALLLPITATQLGYLFGHFADLLPILMHQ